ncbi:MAG: hypothetical protein J0I12_26940 [Candidatus Eremiobacteraeota bacterium]|nr:hypothetical protein [Candidatus Eremiobacteraeota bacterium]
MPSDSSDHHHLIVNARLAAQVQRQQRELGRLQQEVAELRRQNQALKVRSTEKPLVLPGAFPAEVEAGVARQPDLPGCDLAALRSISS